MSLTTEQIKDEFAKFAGKFGPAAIIPAKVLSINADDDTVAIQFSDGSKVDDARLKSVVKTGNKTIIKPALNSIVLVGRIDDSDEYVVLAVDEISSIIHKIGTVEYEITANGFLIKKGADTLKEALINLVEAIEPIVIMQGTQPNFLKLATAKTKIQNLLQ